MYRNDDSSSNYSTTPRVPGTPSMPQSPVLSNMTTPSTMTPLFNESRSSQNSLSTNYTNSTNHPIISSVDSHLPYIDSRLDRTRGNGDYQLFQPRNLRTSELQYRRERIIANVENEMCHKGTKGEIVNTALTFTKEIDVNKQGLVNKVKSGFKYTGSKFTSIIDKLESLYIKYTDVSKCPFY
jgi:hypothetical protein